MDWIHLAQDRDRRWALVNAAMNRRFAYSVCSCWAAENWTAAEEGLCLVELLFIFLFICLFS